MAKESFHTSCLSYIQRFQKIRCLCLFENSKEFTKMAENIAWEIFFFLDTLKQQIKISKHFIHTTESKCTKEKIT